MINSHKRRVLIMNSTSQFGRLVIDSLLERLPPSRLVAGVRNPNSLAARNLRNLGVEVRPCDYARPDELAAAFEGIERLLLISSCEVGQRVSHHCNVIAAARRAGVKLIAYTSTLHADTSPLKIAEEHCETEVALRVSKAPYVLLRNGWCAEDIVVFVLSAIANDALFSFLSSASGVRISAAARADYAAAAAVVLSSDQDWSGRTYELAGDEASTLPSVVAELGRQLGERFSCWRLPEMERWARLVQSGFSERFSALIANLEKGAEKCGLCDENRQLNRLIGRPTTSLATTIAQVLEGLRMSGSLDANPIRGHNPLILGNGRRSIGERRTAIIGARLAVSRNCNCAVTLQACSKFPANGNAPSSATTIGKPTSIASASSAAELRF
jgi:NAD(P)H dehydrogenase (quinone)